MFKSIWGVTIKILPFLPKELLITIVVDVLQKGAARTKNKLDDKVVREVKIVLEKHGLYKEI